MPHSYSSNCHCFKNQRGKCGFTLRILARQIQSILDDLESGLRVKRAIAVSKRESLSLSERVLSICKVIMKLTLLHN